MANKLRRRYPLHDRLETRMIAETFEIWVVPDPICYRYACCQSSFKSVDGMFPFT